MYFDAVRAKRSVDFPRRRHKTFLALLENNNNNNNNNNNSNNTKSFEQLSGRKRRVDRQAGRG